MNIPLDEMQVVKHHPEQYLIFLDHRSDAQRLLSLSSLQNRDRTFFFAPWTEQRYATRSALKFYVRLHIEGVPVHTWREDVAAQIGRHCAIHFVEEHSRRQQRTRTYDLWAWCTNPSAIAKKVWLTVADPDRELPSTDIPRPLVHIHHDRPEGIKYGLTYKLLIHLDELEDLSLPHNDPNRRIEFLWHYGAEDSLGRRRERPLGRQGGGDPPPRRDDEGHRRGTRRHRSQSAWGRVSRCRGAVDDCYSSTQRIRGRDSDHTPHRSRDATPPSWRGWGRGMYNDCNKRARADLPEQPAKAHQNKKSLGKHVSFAMPVFHYCSTPPPAQSTAATIDPPVPLGTKGERPLPLDQISILHCTPCLDFPEREDPMLYESLTPQPGVAHSSLNDRILDMLEAAPGWGPMQSPTPSMDPDAEVAELGDTPPAAATTPTGNYLKHVQQPLTNLKMEAIKILVEQGNRTKAKKKARVTPAQQVQAAVALKG